MKIFAFLLAFLILICPVSASELNEEISESLKLDSAKELVPDIQDNEIQFSPDKTPTENGLTAKAVFSQILVYFANSLPEQLRFVFTILALFIISAILVSLCSSHTTLLSAVRFAVCAVFSVITVRHIDASLTYALEFNQELSSFMTGLLPFFNAISAVGGEFTSLAVQKAVLLSCVNILQSFITSAVIPICKVVSALSLAGYISGIALGAVSEFISTVANKVIVISCSIMCAVLYFQNTVASMTDSLALRSVKIMAGNFIPIVGSFVSEASGTLLSGVRLVKSTFGVFAICVVIYMCLGPLVNFAVIKLAVRFSSVIGKILGCDKESNLFKEISGVYNIVSALMTASACFFIFFLAVFAKSEVR